MNYPLSPKELSYAKKRKLDDDFSYVVHRLNENLIEGHRLFYLPDFYFYRRSFMPRIIERFESAGWKVNRLKFFFMETSWVRFEQVEEEP